MGTEYTEYSIQQVQHTPSTVSIQDYLSSLHSYNYRLTPECSFSFRCAFLQDWLSPASSPWELKGNLTSSHSHSCEVCNWLTESQHPACLLSTASIYFVQFRSITASKCMTKLTRSQPPCPSRSSLDQGLRLYLQTRSITPSKCSSKFARSRPQSASLSSLDDGTKCISNLARLRPPSSHYHGFQVHLPTRSIKASKYISEVNSIPAAKCISKLARSRPPSSHDHGIQVHLHTCSIRASQCIPGFTQSRPPSVSLNSHSIPASKCISKFKQ